jgi:hypothetical protein
MADWSTAYTNNKLLGLKGVIYISERKIYIEEPHHQEPNQISPNAVSKGALGE